MLPVQAQTLDLSTPADAVKALQKTMCSLDDGEPVVYWWEGNVYSRVPGERDRHLFSYQGMNVRACKSVSHEKKGYGYRMVSREVLFYMDPESGKILDTWKNPWTGDTVDVMHVANDPVNRPPLYANGPRGPFELDVTEKGGWYLYNFEVPLFYENPLGGKYQEYVGGKYQANEMFNFYIPKGALLDASRTGVSNVLIGWSRMSQWLPWMKMGGRPGQLMYHGIGRRLDNFEDLPEKMRTEIKANYPTFTSPPPLDDDRPNETSWTVFKEKLQQQRENKKKEDAEH